MILRMGFAVFQGATVTGFYRLGVVVVVTHSVNWVYFR
jgi:hypothetical protein